MTRTLGACILAIAAVFVSAIAFAEDGGVSCATSADCGLPTPYCQPDQHACVTCLADKNCASTEVCDPLTNTCVACRGDADCPPDHPYCGGAAVGCVECKTDANCGDPRIKCFEGLCGKCGDGVCGPHERVQDSPFSSDPRNPSLAHVCQEDCASECPGRAATLGKAKRLGVGTRDLFGLACFGGGDLPDGFVSFVAPRAATYYFLATRLGDGANDLFTVAGFLGGCNGTTSQCNSGAPTVGFSLPLAEGDVMTVVIETESAGTFDVTVTDTPPACPADGCIPTEPPPPPVVDAGVSEAAKALCADNAMTRGDAICDGVTCACEHCPTAYDDCSIVPGCSAISDCLQQKNCVGVDCYASGACRTVIDTNGGISAAGFRTATALQSCAVRYGCSLPCEKAVEPDAGTTGGLCSPGRDVVCACNDGGSGTKTCSADGDGFSVCTCGGPVDTIDSGCDCNLSAGSRPSTAGWLAGAALAIALGRRGNARTANRGKRS